MLLHNYYNNRSFRLIGKNNQLFFYYVHNVCNIDPDPNFLCYELSVDEIMVGPDSVEIKHINIIIPLWNINEMHNKFKDRLGEEISNEVFDEVKKSATRSLHLVNKRIQDLGNPLRLKKVQY